MGNNAKDADMWKRVREYGDQISKMANMELSVKPFDKDEEENESLYFINLGVNLRDE